MSYFIAEVSSNHSQDIGRCLKLIEAAKKSGFDAIKFQVHIADAESSNLR